MFFLFRMAFWLCVILVLLPAFVGGSTKSTSAGDTQVSATEAVSAASATFADLSHFCDRQPHACTAGAQAAVVIGQRAQAGAKILYDFLSERNGPRTTGSLAASDPTRSMHGTLTPSDLGPAWRGPKPAKEPQQRRPG